MGFIIFRYERGRRRRTSDVYRDKLLEFTMSSAATTKKVRHTSAAPKLALPTQSESGTFDSDENNQEMCMKIIKDYQIVSPRLQSSIADMDDVKLATIVKTCNTSRMNFNTRRVSV